MTVIGFHCSHEQINPAQLLRDVQHAEQAGFTAGMSSDHFSPWSERQGESGFAWSFLGAALATTAAVRRRQCTRAALSPRDHRPGDRHPCADVPGAVLGGARIRRSLQRTGHRRGMAPQGRARPTPRRVRRRHPAAAQRRGGQSRRPCSRQPGAAVDAARRPSPTSSARPSHRRPPPATPRGPTAS